MFRTRILTLSVALAAVLVAACIPQKVIVPPQPTARPQVTARAPESLADQAAAAWSRGDMMESERLYGLALQDPATPDSVRQQAWERQATAAVNNGHVHSALEILENWRSSVPGVDAQPVWLQLWDRAADQLLPEDAARRADGLWRDNLRPVPVRFAAVKRVLPTGDPSLSAVLTELYEQSDQPGRAAMERDLLAALAPLRDVTLYLLIGPQPGPDAQFPWSVYTLETARRTAATATPESLSADAPDTDPMAALFARVSAIPFADPSIVGVVRNQMSVDETGLSLPELSLPVPSVQELLADGASYGPVCLAMVLPLGGPYGQIGSSIQAGAAAAQTQMGQAGVPLDVHFIDTQNPMWLQQLAQLPPQCVAVGGPIQPEAFAVAKERGALNGRAAFAFFGRLDQAQEGVDAWRFFPSRDDQIATMLRFAQQMGINQFGIFHPDDAYGTSMAAEFSSLAASMGGMVTNSMAYTSDAPDQWTSQAGSFVGVRVVNKVPVPSSTFRAVFLPDSWANMDMIVSTLFYQGEDSQLLLGTSLWEQALLENPPAMLNNMGLAVFPGMWNARSLAVPARLLQAGLPGRQADTWTALGYDFVRFASAMQLQPGMSPQDVNARIVQAQNMAWSMAPIRWQHGRAAQDLFVLSPSTSSPVLVDPAVIKQRLDNARGRSERRSARALGRR